MSKKGSAKILAKKNLKTKSRKIKKNKEIHKKLIKTIKYIGNSYRYRFFFIVQLLGML